MEINWRKIQRNNFTNWHLLSDFLHLDEKQRLEILTNTPFSLNLPKRLADKIKKKCLNDPILLQFLPLTRENEEVEGFFIDPVSDFSFQKTPKLLHKYPGRVLLLCSSACVMHCRFCFRRNYPYEHTDFDFDKELSIIQEDPSIYEVILSGGDPLSLSDEKLTALILNLEKIPHLKLLRLHTRFPIGIPERITDSFLETLSKTRLQVIFILHANHPRELDEEVMEALKKIQKVGGTVLSQTVLLKMVNDSEESLSELFLILVQGGVTPYYLHQLDRVKGCSSFEVTKERGIQLINNLRKRLPGYAIPTYVQEIPFKQSKTPVME